MKIKVSGMRNADNIREAVALGVDFIGLEFSKQSKRYVSSISSNAGIIPDRADSGIVGNTQRDCKLVGIFADEMMQNVVTAAYNYHLDFIQLDGDEGTTYVDNLSHTLDPDIRKGIKIIKTIHLNREDDLLKTKEYEGHVDFFLFDFNDNDGSAGKSGWSILDAYDGTVPFLLNGGIGPDDGARVGSFRHPMFLGIDINTRFETEPGIMDIAKLKSFIENICK